MKKSADTPYLIDSISALHELMELPKPLHPLVSLFDNTQVFTNSKQLPRTFVFDFYNISYKKLLKGRTGYGQNYYDFDDGTMMFTSPKQLITNTNDGVYYGVTLLFHPDFIRHHPLGKNIKQFGFFSYESNEALHLSDSEKQTVLSVFKNIENELHHSIDDFSQDIILAHIEALLNYSNRYYKRQFITRKTVSYDLLSKIDQVIDSHFESERPVTAGLLTVEWLATQINVSPRYLSDMLRSLTGQNAQHLIHDKLIEKAKEYLSLTSMSVSEIAFQLGFEYPQSFSKLFKKKTNVTPLEFKQGLHHN
jgi:AraC-like DNA-binding protein